MSTGLFEALTGLRDCLAGAGGAKTCRIGLEASISPDDYPIIRIIPSETEERVNNGGELATLTIYYGHPVDESSTDEDGENIGLEGVYKVQSDMRDEILARLDDSGLPVAYTGTVFDQDSIAGYKMTGLTARMAF